MFETTAVVATANAGKYVTQLCKHWSHKLAVELDDSVGVVRFAGATATLWISDDSLAVTIQADDAPTLEKMESVVASHLDRFAFREAPLPFEWERIAVGN